jgi:hypothetical protein
MEKAKVVSKAVYRVALRGDAILAHPRWNKGTAFTEQERKDFKLVGRLPSRLNTIDDQCARAWDQLDSQDSDLAKNAFLQSLHDQNWILFYELLRRNLRKLMPIVYTPTEACLQCFPDTYNNIGIRRLTRSQTIPICLDGPVTVFILLSPIKIQWKKTSSSRREERIWILSYAQTRRPSLASAIRVLGYVNHLRTLSHSTFLTEAHRASGYVFLTFSNIFASYRIVKISSAKAVIYTCANETLWLSIQHMLSFPRLSAG